jgi:hypothetical protein
MQLPLTSRQPSNAGTPRRPAFALSAYGREKEKKQQVNPALRLPAERYARCLMKAYWNLF